MLPTPSHTVGPFYGYALPFPGGGDIAPVGHPDTITLHGLRPRRRGQPAAGRLRWSCGAPTRTATSPERRRLHAARPGERRLPRPQRRGVHRLGARRRPTPTATGRARTLRPGARGRNAPVPQRVRVRARAAASTCSPGSTCRATRPRSPPTRCSPGWTEARRGTLIADGARATAPTVSTSAFRAKARRSSWSSSDTHARQPTPVCSPPGGPVPRPRPRRATPPICGPCSTPRPR